MKNESENNTELSRKVDEDVEKLAIKLVIGGIAVACVLPALEVCSPMLFMVAISAFIADLIALTFLAIIIDDNKKVKIVNEPNKIKRLHKIGYAGPTIITEYDLSNRRICREEHKRVQGQKKILC